MKPRAVLILCEGVTEKIYFDFVVQNKRIATVLPVEVLGKQGQHTVLIKRCVKKRKLVAEEMGIDEEDIEVWAVCDQDCLRTSYQKLQRCANQNQVMLAFSNPQFETYLVQHFERKKTTSKRKKIEKELSEYLGVTYDKTNLDWFDEMIDRDPAKVVQAIINSDQLDNHTRPPFLTVQKLTKRLFKLAK